MFFPSAPAPLPAPEPEQKEIPEPVENIGSVADDVKAVAGRAATQASEAATEAAKYVSATAEAAKTTIKEKAKVAEEVITDTAKEAASAVTEKANEAKEAVTETVQAAESFVAEKAAVAEAAIESAEVPEIIEELRAKTPEIAVCTFDLPAESPVAATEAPPVVSSSISCSADPYPPAQEVVEEPFIETTRDSFVLDAAIDKEEDHVKKTAVDELKDFLEKPKEESAAANEAADAVDEAVVQQFASATLDAAAVIKDVVSQIEPTAVQTMSAVSSDPPFVEISESKSVVELQAPVMKFTPEPEDKPVVEEMIAPQVASLTTDEVESIGVIEDSQIKEDSRSPSPAPVHQYTPSAYKEEDPVKKDAVDELKDFLEKPKEESAAKADSPGPVKEDSPVFVKEDSPAPIKEDSPAPIKENSPVFVKEDSPVSLKEDSPAPVREDSPVFVKEDSPVIVKEDSPTVVKEDSPVFQKEDSPAPVKEESSEREESPEKEESIVKLKNFLEQPKPTNAAVDVETIGSVDDDIQNSTNKTVDTLEK